MSTRRLGLTLLFAAAAGSLPAAFTALYGSDGNDFYQFTGSCSVANLKSDCWNGLIMFAMSVQASGDLTLGGGNTFNFKSLYVTGTLTLSGSSHTNTTSLYVGGSFIINGPSGTSSFGPTYVGGSVNWGGALSVQASPLYVVGNFVTQGGPFNHVLGPTYVGGTVTIAGNQASFLCPILVTPGQITTSGSAVMGTVAAPMVLLQNGGATGNMSLGSNGTFTGLLINMDGGVTLPGGNGSTADIVGAVFSTGNITFGGNTKVCYNPTALSHLQTTATSTSTTVLPGTWQELSPSGSF